MEDHLTLLYKEDLGPVSALRVEGEEREKMPPLSIQAPSPVNIVKSNVTLKIAVNIIFFLTSSIFLLLRFVSGPSFISASLGLEL